MAMWTHLACCTFFVRKHADKRQRRIYEEIASQRAKDLDILKTLETTRQTGNKLEKALRIIQDLSAKLNLNKENAVLAN